MFDKEVKTNCPSCPAFGMHCLHKINGDGIWCHASNEYRKKLLKMKG